MNTVHFCHVGFFGTIADHNPTIEKVGKYDGKWSLGGDGAHFRVMGDRSWYVDAGGRDYIFDSISHEAIIDMIKLGKAFRCDEEGRRII